MTVIAITWRALMDDRTCPICRALHGFTWVFNVTSQPLPDELTHPTYGVVWNKSTGSRAHGHERFNCRCGIRASIDASDVLEKAEALKTRLEVMASEQLE
jgi:uncharacterized protein with gpF-like domain